MHRTQIEITTQCNYTCRYCYSKHLPDKFMSWPVFKDIVQAEKYTSSVFHLQGEGEPLLHPAFFNMCSYIKSKTAIPITVTTNGSMIGETIATRIKFYISALTVSLDTLNKGEAIGIGRPHLDKTLAGLKLLKAAEYHSVTIAAVDFGQDLTELEAFCLLNDYCLTIQPLQQKRDYVLGYIELPRKIKKDKPKAVRCSYVMGDIMHWYNVEGIKAPCCYIKDLSYYPGYAELKNQFAAKQVPACCTGCFNLG